MNRKRHRIYVSFVVERKNDWHTSKNDPSYGRRWSDSGAEIFKNKKVQENQQSQYELFLQHSANYLSFNNKAESRGSALLWIKANFKILEKQV
jgi:hypothetical protein